MLNKKNAAYAVIGFALVGCNNMLGACDCCKSVPQALERFTFILKNLKGVTYENLSDYFKKDNATEKELVGKELISKNLVDKGHTLTDNAVLYIVDNEKTKNDMKVYKESEKAGMKTDCAKKKCKSIEITFTAVNGSTKNIAENSEEKFKVSDIKVGNEENVDDL